MSKKQKTARSQKRKAAKRTERAARKAHYEALRDAGQNKKSKNRLRREGALTVGNVSHPSGKCHNIGCHACNPAEHNQSASARLVTTIAGPGRGITTDAAHATHKLYAPKRQLTKLWGAP
jgi:hypothetical protein